MGCPCTPLQLCDVSAAGSRLWEEELRENLEQEEARLEQMRAQMSRNQKRLIEFENIIDNLFLRLQGVFIPGQVPQGAGGARPGRRGSAGTPGTATTRGSLSPPRWFFLPQERAEALIERETFPHSQTHLSWLFLQVEEQTARSFQRFGLKQQRPSTARVVLFASGHPKFHTHPAILLLIKELIKPLAGSSSVFPTLLVAF